MEQDNMDQEIELIEREDLNGISLKGLQKKMTIDDVLKERLIEKQEKNMAEEIIENKIIDDEQKEQKFNIIKKKAENIVVNNKEILSKVYINIVFIILDFTFSIAFFIAALNSNNLNCHFFKVILAYVLSVSYLIGAAKHSAVIYFNFKIEGPDAVQVVDFNTKLKEYHHNVIIFNFSVGLMLIILVSRILDSSQQCGKLTTLYYIWLYLYNGLYILSPIMIFFYVYIDHDKSIMKFNMIINFFGVPKIKTFLSKSIKKDQ